MKIEVRPEVPGDIGAIRSVITRAFRSQNEPMLVDRLREAGAAALSLVAVVDGKIAGHILFSPMTMDPDLFGVAIFGLAPLAVAPEYQKQGIGRKLVQRGLDIGIGWRWHAVFVLGASGYYRRFGFKKASQYALFTEYDVPEENFMVVFLRPNAIDSLHGVALYHPIFKETGV